MSPLEATHEGYHCHSDGKSPENVTNGHIFIELVFDITSGERAMHHYPCQFLFLLSLMRYGYSCETGKPSPACVSEQIDVSQFNLPLECGTRTTCVK